MALPPVLTGVRVIELAGLAPGPFAGLLLADAGASVLRVDRPQSPDSAPQLDPLTRHKSSICVDLKSAAGVVLLKSLASHADIIIDPFRPGVLERLGLGPDTLLQINPRLIFGRMTGFRRDGKYKDMAGHDINYIAVSGALSLLGGKSETPVPPANLLGDFAGGGAALFQGILLALLALQKTGKGQIVEANMVDGSAYLASLPRLTRRTWLWDRPRGENELDGGAPWYGTYKTKDGKFMAVGTVEPRFFQTLMEKLDLAGSFKKDRQDRNTWDELRQILTERFKQKTRKEWEVIFDGQDACTTPVLEMDELESGQDCEGDQRPMVTLSLTPCLAIKSGPPGRDYRQGQGLGCKGDGWTMNQLRPGENGEKILKEWLNWGKGKDYEEKDGGLVKTTLSKL